MFVTRERGGLLLISAPCWWSFVIRCCCIWGELIWGLLWDPFQSALPREAYTPSPEKSRVLWLSQDLLEVPYFTKTYW